MGSSRRGTITALGTAGAATAVGALAIGAYVDDERSSSGPAVDGVALDDTETDSDAEAVANGLAAVRIAHLSPVTSAVDVTIDGEQLVSGVTVDEVSPYLQFEPGTYSVQFTASDDPETVLFEDEIAIEAAYYTIAVLDDLESDGPTVVLDAGAALVRVVHASSLDDAVDVSAGGRLPLFENVAFGTATGYAPVPTGSYTLEVATVSEESSGDADETSEADDETATDEADETAEADETTDETDDAAADESDPDTAPDDEADADPDDESAATDDVAIDEEDVPDDIDEEDVPEDIDPDDIPEDIDEGDIPDDIDPDDIPDDLSEVELPDNASQRVDGDLDVSLLSTGEIDTEPDVTLEVSLERGRAYTGYVIDDPASPDQEPDRMLTVTVDGEFGETVDEPDESY
ncbi:DUF4397 domain-containing protein [Halobacteria archaeon AArc-m2/3/4]|uniref:DUF4397 domain-containing protein n=1 Tax=Natronoglomus mannanivorans TaxID=2979990 RepID=A0ABT2QCR2_9EURY|nr:DUF4397 domain-containing protein [Halobacteria archaeon AArc-m2/3/4]